MGKKHFWKNFIWYARWLGRELGSRGIPLKAEGGWDRLMDRLGYDSWKMLAGDIRQLHSDAQK